MNRKQQFILCLYCVVLMVSAALMMGAADSRAVGAASDKPTCSNASKAGTAVLSPNGTSNAITAIEFNLPFCSGPVIIVATVSNESTAGERVAAQALGLESAAVSLQLDEPSNLDFEVNWMAAKATQ